MRVVAQGPERGAIRIERHWQNSKFVQEVVLDADSPEFR
jgi:hypothetical protein